MYGTQHRQNWSEFRSREHRFIVPEKFYKFLPSNCNAKYIQLSVIFVVLLLILLLSVNISLLRTYVDYELYPPSGSVSFRVATYEDICARELTVEVKRLKEVRGVLSSVRRDLISVVQKLDALNAEYESISKNVFDRKMEYKILGLDVAELKLLQKELSDSKYIRAAFPLKPIISQLNPLNDSAQTSETKFTATSLDDGRLEFVFNFSRCSLLDRFYIYIYNVIPVKKSKLASQYIGYMRENPDYTSNPDKACLLIAFIDSTIDPKSLLFWKSGANHVILNLDQQFPSSASSAIVVSSVFPKGRFRSETDISILLDAPEYHAHDCMRLPALLPASRKYLVVHYGLVFAFHKVLLAQFNELTKNAKEIGDEVYLSSKCVWPSPSCTDRSSRVRYYRDSIFALIIPSPHEDMQSTFLEQIFDSLAQGAIPVIVSLHVPLPISDLIDWRRISLRLPLARFPELHFILRSISQVDILEMKRRGRFIYESYFANTKVISATLIATLRNRIGVPDDRISGVDGEPLFNNSYVAPILDPSNARLNEEYLGPIEAPHDSESYTHNFTSLHMYSYHIWNEVVWISGRILEYLPFQSLYPSGAEEDPDTSFNFRVIQPGSGVQFSKALGGNSKREQFTVVILTYEREAILYKSLERLNNVPYLNKVIVVSNGGSKLEEKRWPRINVPVYFIKSKLNSVNNRFIPYKQITTEAVLSLDDDVELGKDEIVFAFRVWRENRQRLVGFPARHHIREGNRLLYRSNHTCQYSMILLGASFLHKAYLYSYTYAMPEVIRQRIDQIMNCEDIAMNFLVSHLTRQPPIKVTSRWSMNCPSCQTMLSRNPTHFVERHGCIDFLVEVYGYNALLFSQYRADSVLFKTRIPQNHQKCFQFV